MIKEIETVEIETARKVLNDHLVKPLNREGALESLFFCIASQATNWEHSCRIIYGLRRASHGNSDKFTSWSDLTDKEKINKIVHNNRWRFAYSRRFDSSIDYFKNMPGEWWVDIKNSDTESRTEYCREIKGVGLKTFSFWNICLGGNKLLALDVYVMRGLSELGIEMNPYFFISKSRRETSQKVRKTPSAKEYTRLEDEARNLFSKDEHFLLEDGGVNMALVDSLLWWRGANRNGTQQLSFFGNNSPTWVLPYSGYNPTSR